MIHQNSSESLLCRNNGALPPSDMSSMFQWINDKMSSGHSEFFFSGFCEEILSELLHKANKTIKKWKLKINIKIHIWQKLARKLHTKQSFSLPFPTLQSFLLYSQMIPPADPAGMTSYSSAIFSETSILVPCRKSGKWKMKIQHVA